MKRTVSVSLFVLLLLVVSFPALVSGSDGGSSRSALDARGREQICAAADGGVEKCATRYPREYREWQDSVHGRAYLSGDTDAPGCTDCHDDPEKKGIRTATFRLDSSFRCARCHGDEKLMEKHEVVTDVYSSYLADFHGRAIRYYRSNDSSMWRYEAVCADCHASHAIYDADDQRSSIAPANLLGTCQQCHPGAEANFTSTATGHFRIDRESSLLAYYVERIYQILIPVFVGLMAAYVGLDITHRLRTRFRRKQ